MKRALFLLLFLMLATGAPAGSRALQTPKLLVLVAVDGLGADVLARAEPALTGGFRRLLSEGRSFPDTVAEQTIKPERNTRSNRFVRREHLSRSHGCSAVLATSD